MADALWAGSGGDCTYRQKLSVPVQSATATGNIPLLLPVSLLDAAFWAAASTDGADIRLALDAEGTQLVPLDLARFDWAGQVMQAWALVPLVQGGDLDLWLFAGNSAALAPDAAADYGRNSVWVDYRAVYHFDADNWTLDSTGNGADFDAAGAFGQLEGPGEFGAIRPQDTDQYHNAAGIGSEWWTSATDDWAIQAWISCKQTPADWESLINLSSSNNVTTQLVTRWGYMSARYYTSDGTQVINDQFFAESLIETEDWQRFSWTTEAIGSTGNQTYAAYLDGEQIASHDYYKYWLTPDLASDGLIRLSEDYAFSELRFTDFTSSAAREALETANQSDPAGFYEALAGEVWEGADPDPDDGGADTCPAGGVCLSATLSMEISLLASVSATLGLVAGQEGTSLSASL